MTPCLTLVAVDMVLVPAPDRHGVLRLRKSVALSDERIGVKDDEEHRIRAVRSAVSDEARRYLLTHTEPVDVDTGRRGAIARIEVESAFSRWRHRNIIHVFQKRVHSVLAGEAGRIAGRRNHGQGVDVYRT
jgi:hypothetical protein